MNPRILLVENSESDYWCQLVLQASAGWADVDATSPKDCLRLLEAKPYDCVILDATPGDLTDLIKSLLQVNVGTRVLVATTSPTWQRVREAYRAGASAYIVAVAGRKLTVTLSDALQQGLQNTEAFS